MDGYFKGKQAERYLPLLPIGRKKGRQRGIIPLREKPRWNLWERKKKKNQIPKLPVSARQAEAKPLLQTLLEMSRNGNCVEMCSSGFCVPGKLSHVQLPGAASKHRAEAVPFPLRGGWPAQRSWWLIHPGSCSLSAFLDRIPERQEVAICSWGFLLGWSLRGSGKNFKYWFSLM